MLLGKEHDENNGYELVVPQVNNTYSRMVATKADFHFFLLLY